MSDANVAKQVADVLLDDAGEFHACIAFHAFAGETIKVITMGETINATAPRAGQIIGAMTYKHKPPRLVYLGEQPEKLGDE